VPITPKKEAENNWTMVLVRDRVFFAQLFSQLPLIPRYRSIPSLNSFHCVVVA
jgi:hypothetical protein